MTALPTPAVQNGHSHNHTHPHDHEHTTMTTARTATRMSVRRRSPCAWLTTKPSAARLG